MEVVIAVPAETFEDFYRGNRTWAIQLAWLLTHDRSAAEDLAHEAFTAVYARFESLDNPAAYLRRTIVNGVYERTRRAERERRRNLLVIAGTPTSVDGPTGGVVDAIAKLPLNQRTAIVLRYWAGLADREIAEAMGMRPGSVRSALSRATEQLRKDIS